MESIGGESIPLWDEDRLVRTEPLLHGSARGDEAHAGTWQRPRLAIGRALLQLAQFSAQPQSRFVSDIHCVTTWSRYDNRWEGLSTRDLLDACRPRAEARFVVLHSHDGYTTNLALEDFAAEDALLAHSWSDAPLEAEHGGPVRLVVPHLYFWKSAKWLQSIELLAEDAPGYWEVRGYHNRGDPWKEERYSGD